MKSKYRYNNGKWHTVRITRKQATGTLEVDGGDVVEGLAVGNTRIMTLTPPFSFGGVSESYRDDANINTGLDGDSIFHGCIRNIQVNSTPLGVPTKEINVLPCTDQIEDGAFFGGGYVKVKQKQNQPLPIISLKETNSNYVLIFNTKTHTVGRSVDSWL